ncbi:MAG: flagellar M-ring protein FliF [Myxococcales bacterium]|nr:flagellar M-ring protein FliF [Myxococcales bacterium]
MGALTNTLTQIRELWGRLGARARAALVSVAVLGVVAAGVVALIGGAPKRVLFSGLDPKDAAAVVAALEAAKIPYELGAGGTMVEVPGADVDRARLMLAEQNLPATGNVGFELFAEQSFGLTEFAQKVNYRRALQGELERTIGALDPIAGVRVHITQPDRAVFEDEKQAPTASVTVDLRPGRPLGERQVGAIRHLVAAAVEGLDPGDVTVVTTDGTLLSRGGADEGAAAALDHEVDLERDLERRIARLLERTVGIDGVEVTVAAEMDFSQTDTTEESYDPEQTAIRSEALQESFEGAGAGSGAASGVAGAASNGPGATPGPAAGGADSSSRTVRSRNFEINRTVVHTVGAKATVKRLTVAVLVDGHYTTPEGATEPVYAPRTEAELAELQAVVENAMGFNSSRGDRVKISSAPFRDRLDPESVSASPVATPTWMFAAAAGGAAVLGLAAWMFLRRKRSRALTPEVLSLPARVSEVEGALARGDAGQPAALPGQAAAAALPEGRDAARERALALASADPERTADIIRGWLRTDQPA